MQPKVNKEKLRENYAKIRALAGKVPDNLPQREIIVKEQKTLCELKGGECE